MKATAAILALFLAAVADGLAAGGCAAGDGGAPPAARPLPAALARYYPPIAGQPAYLFKMLSLESSFSAIVADLTEGDIEGARGSFEEFRRHYREAGDMVPEWRSGFPEREVGELGAALSAGDGSLATGAAAAVGRSCHSCHLATMVPVQQRFRWGNWNGFDVKDPLTGVATPYTRFKAAMAANLAGITVDLKQGQTGNARKQLDEFATRFRALGDSCGRCHDGGGRLYADRDMQDAVAEIGRALSADPPDARTVTSLVRKIGSGSCSKCHLVHVPAALAAASGD